MFENHIMFTVATTQAWKRAPRLVQLGTRDSDVQAWPRVAQAAPGLNQPTDLEAKKTEEGGENIWKAPKTAKPNDIQSTETEVNQT